MNFQGVARSATLPEINHYYFYHPSSRRQMISHYDEYNHDNYIDHFTKYVERKKAMRWSSYEIPLERKNALRRKAKDATENRKVFTILGYYPAIRHVLLRLGWTEKIDQNTAVDLHLIDNFNVQWLHSAPYVIPNETPDRISCQYFEEKFLSDCIGNGKPNLLFALSTGINLIQSHVLDSDTIVGYYPATNFCTKSGLNTCLSRLPVYRSSNDSLRYPRAFDLTTDTGMSQFIQNYRETSCFGLLRYVKLSYETLQPPSTRRRREAVPWSVFDIAEKVCFSKIDKLRHGLEQGIDDHLLLNAYNWRQFEKNLSILVSSHASFSYVEDREYRIYYERAKAILEIIEEISDQAWFDGMHNVWVLKPIAQSSGYGVGIYRSFESIKKAVADASKVYTGCVVQKYIERPMLIHGVKFDLRVYYLVTNIDRLKIWVYHEGYVRFCSKPYSNALLDNRRHVSNVRVQTEFRKERDPKVLPPELMWDFNELRNYFLRKLNLPGQWSKVMAAIESSIVTVMHCALQEGFVSVRKNTFLLFGADFLIHENYEPCLIEINDGPGFSPTTSVIAKKTTELLSDMTQVVLGEINNSSDDHYIDHGNFNLVYDQATCTMND